MAKWRDKVFFVSSMGLRHEGCTSRLQPRDRIYFWKRRWIVVERPYNVNGYLIVEETPQGEWIAATIAFLRWLLRIYGWMLSQPLRVYSRMYEALPNPNDYGAARLPLPLTPFWRSAPLFSVLAGLRDGAILNGGEQIQWPLTYGQFSRDQYPQSFAVTDPNPGCAAPGAIVRIGNAPVFIPAPPSPMQRPGDSVLRGIDAAI